MLTLSLEIVTHILHYTWVDVWDLALQLLVSRDWCNRIIVPAVPRMLCLTSPNLGRLHEFRVRPQREERLIQAACSEEIHPLLDLVVFRQVVRLQIYWSSRPYVNEHTVSTDLLASELLATIHDDFKWWAPRVIQEVLASMGDPPAVPQWRNSLGVIRSRSKFNFFSFWWRRSCSNTFDMERILEVLKTTIDMPQELVMISTSK